MDEERSPALARLAASWATASLLACGGQMSGVGGESTGGHAEAETASVDTQDAGDSSDGGSDSADPLRTDATLVTERAALRRLTATQLRATVAALLGPQIAADAAVLAAIPDDLVRELFTHVGASVVLTSPIAVEQYEDLALAATALVFDDARRRHSVVGCALEEAACRSTFVDDFGARAWRRPLTIDERSRYDALWEQMQLRFDDVWGAARYVVAAFMTSPNFMHLVEVGEDDPTQPGSRRYTSLEMASRLSYFLWDGPPDASLLQAAEAGMLVDEDVVVDQVQRMLDDERAAAAYRAFFVQLLGLSALDVLTKDTIAFPMASAALFEQMRGEVERIIAREVFAEEGTRRDLLTTRTTFVTPALARLYGVTADAPADGEGFSEVTLPSDDARQGTLGTAAFLAANARVTRTSPTLRGLFVQRRLLCNALPPPPADVETELPDDNDGSGPQTMRTLLAAHAADPECAGCHTLTDPAGLSFEHFDGIGRYRATDRGLPLDVSGALSGVAFDGLSGLAVTLADDERAAACLVRHVYRYAVGHLESEGEEALLHRLEAWGDAPIRELWAAIATSPGFRYLEVRP